MQNKWGWLIVAASFLIHVTSDGVAYTFGLFFVPIVNEFNASRSATSWISATNSAMTNLAGPIAAAAIDKFGCRTTSIFGSFLAAFGFAISYYADSVLYLGITIGLCAGLGMGFIYVPLIVSVNLYFQKEHRSFATGLATCGSGIGTASLAPLVEFLIRRFGWRYALVYIGGIILLCVIFSCSFKPMPVIESTTVIENDENDDVEEVQTIGPISYSNEPDLDKDAQQLQVKEASEKQSRPSDKSRQQRHSVPHIALIPEENLFITCSQPALLGVIGSIHSVDNEPAKRRTLNMDKNDEEHRLDNYNSNSAEISTGVHTTDLLHTEQSTNVINDQRKCCNCPDVIKNTFKTMTDVSILKDPDFVVFAVSNFFTNIGCGVPYIYLVDMAVGDSSTPIHSLIDASFLIAIIGGANTVSRVVLGYLGDKAWVNRLYLYTIALIVCGIATVIAPHIQMNLNILRVYAATFGVTIGVYVSLTSVILVDLFGVKTLNNTFGLLLLFQGVANIIGPPSVGVLCDEFHSYKYGFGFAGGMIVFSGIMLLKIVVRRKSKSTTNAMKTSEPLAEQSECPSTVPHPD